MQARTTHSHTCLPCLPDTHPLNAGLDFLPVSQFRRLRNWELPAAKLHMRLELEVLGIRPGSIEWGTDHVERLYARVGRREAEVTSMFARDDHLLELYIEHCMPPPPFVRWDPSHMFGLEWKLAVMENHPSQYSPVELSRLRCLHEWDALAGFTRGERTVVERPHIHNLLESPPPAGADDFRELPVWDSPEWRDFCGCPSRLSINTSLDVLRCCVGFSPPAAVWDSRDRELWWRDFCVASHPNDWGWLDEPERHGLIPIDALLPHQRPYPQELPHSEEAKRIRINEVRRRAERDRAQFAVLNALRGRLESTAAQIRRRKEELASVSDELFA